MIDKNTVLILGAGASYDFGYPLAWQLKEQILSSLTFQFDVENPNYLNPIKGKGPLDAAAIVDLGNVDMKLQFLLNNCGFNIDEILTFKNDFFFSPKVSIDAFLEHRPEFLTLGKVLIAIAILKNENEYALFDDTGSGNWYKYLFNRMNCDWDTFQKNKVSVITYNYDRTFEYFFVKSLMHTFGKPAKECVEKVRSFDIIHVHGLLADYPWDTLNVKPYSSTLEAAHVIEASKRLNIITEEADSASYGKINQLIKAAEQVFILGFGFDDRNLQRLDLSQYENYFYSTRVGLSDLELRTIHDRSNRKIIFSKSNLGIVDFFKEEASLSGYKNMHGSKGGILTFR